jgi:hypothetical protein
VPRQDHRSGPQESHHLFVFGASGSNGCSVTDDNAVRISLKEVIIKKGKKLNGNLERGGGGYKTNWRS